MTLHLTDVAESVSAAPAVLDTPRSRGVGSLYRDGFKRLFDLSVTAVASLIWLPVIAVLAFLVALDGHSPFYTQRRVGRDGRVFRMIKLRSMVADADAELARHLAAHPEAQAEWDATQKLKNDPRITRIGQMLRATSMDELPQLINVLRGDMSLVGPRPFMENQRGLYPGLGYYRVRPGITGLWQVSERNDSAFAYRAVLDDEYERTLSFKTDVSILQRTVGAVISCTGY
ncbi:MAG: sugar transferase [Paracoccaceae bacterium]|nr:sugar transferase [Paracoccaceae bacterium]